MQAPIASSMDIDTTPITSNSVASNVMIWQPIRVFGAAIAPPPATTDPSFLTTVYVTAVKPIGTGIVWLAVLCNSIAFPALRLTFRLHEHLDRTRATRLSVGYATLGH